MLIDTIIVEIKTTDATVEDRYLIESHLKHALAEIDFKLEGIAIGQGTMKVRRELK
jgi:hypothetical protein